MVAYPRAYPCIAVCGTVGAERGLEEEREERGVFVSDSPHDLDVVCEFQQNEYQHLCADLPLFCPTGGGIRENDLPVVEGHARDGAPRRCHRGFNNTKIWHDGAGLASDPDDDELFESGPSSK